MRITLISLLLIIGHCTYGQNFDNLMTKKQLDCSDISKNSSSLFQKYFSENKQDSARLLLIYWEKKCGLREPLLRSKILLSLHDGNFQDSILTSNFLSYILNYQNRIQAIRNPNFYQYDNYSSYYGFIPPGQDFDNFTLDLARSLNTKYPADSFEYLLTEFYSNNSDTILTKIQSEKYSDSKLYQEYFSTLDKYINMPEAHASFISGIWIPTGGAEILGIHPVFGFQVGAKVKKMTYDLSISLKVGRSPNHYLARHTKTDNSTELTNHFLGGYIGLDVGRDIISFNGNDIRLLAGFGFDGFDALDDKDGNNDNNSESANSYNFNFGVGYRHFINNSLYMELQAKYNIVDYTLNNVVDFTGNTISINLIIGGLQNYIKSNALKSLKYKWRK